MSHPSFPGNIPAGGAATFSGWARNGQKPTPDDLTPEAQAYREYAQIQATLALAFEQRMTTLATLFNTPENSAIPGVDYAEAARQLSEGLGLGDTK